MNAGSWLDAVTALGNEPDAAIACPECQQVDLRVLDVFAGANLTHMERIISCPACKKWEALLMRTNFGEEIVSSSQALPSPATMKSIKLMAEYQCSPLWSDEEPYNINPDNLPLSSALKGELLQWAAQFDATLDWEYPPDSGFATEKDARLFRERGFVLAGKLQSELAGQYSVSYRRIGSGKTGSR